MNLDKKDQYEAFHLSTSVQKKIITKNNFTYKMLLEVVDAYLQSGDKILDIGCGAGTLCLYYAQKGYSVSGIDISSKAIESAKESAKYLHLDANATFEKMDFPNEIPREKFDFIIFTEVIEHLKDDNLALEQIFRLLKPKGIVFLSTPSKNAPLHLLGLAREFDKRVGHLRRYTLSELQLKCKKQGFKILESKKTEGIVRNFLYLNPLAGQLVRFIKFFLVDIVLFIDKISLIFFGESNLFIVAQKP